MNIRTAITGKTARMAHVNRYSSFPLIRPENVAEHSWWVTFISMLIGEDMNYRWTPECGRDWVNVGLLLERALVHDLSECVSGDIIRSYKYSSEAVLAVLKHADTLNMEQMVDEFGSQGSHVMFQWSTAKDDDIEGLIVRFADLAVVAFYVRDEYRTGNKALLAVLEDMYTKWFNALHASEHLGYYADQIFPNRDWRSILDD